MLESTASAESSTETIPTPHRRLVAAATAFSWVSIVVGAIAMVATYPGRTHGLGMVTEPLLKDFGLSTDDGRVLFSVLGFWATLLGATFCVPVGWLLDRVGQRWVLFGNMTLLGISVLLLSTATTLFTLFIGLILTRGLGQAALSVVSISVVSNSHSRSKIGLAMAFYAILAMPLHVVLIEFAKWALVELQLDWRSVWECVGLCIIVLSFSAWCLPTNDRNLIETHTNDAPADQLSYTLWQALRTPAFWLFSVTISLWGMIYAGTALFNQDIFQELGFDSNLYFEILKYTTMVGLVSKLFFGWLVNHVRLTSLLGTCLLLSAISLAGLPFATQTWHAYAYGTALGIASGAVALLFFASWGKLYGHGELGQIQGVAQMMTVFASAAGPLVFAYSKRQTSSYSTIFIVFAIILTAMSAIAFFTTLPRETAKQLSH